MVGPTRPVPLHRETHPDLDVKGCFGCKAAGIRFGGIERLRSMRDSGDTEERVKQEIYEGARMRGTDIRRADTVSPTSGGLL